MTISDKQERLLENAKGMCLHFIGKERISYEALSVKLKCSNSTICGIIKKGRKEIGSEILYNLSCLYGISINQMYEEKLTSTDLDFFYTIKKKYQGKFCQGMIPVSLLF